MRDRAYCTSREAAIASSIEIQQGRDRVLRSEQAKDFRELSDRGTNFLIAEMLVFPVSVAPIDVALGCNSSKFVSGGSLAVDYSLNVLRD